MGNYLSPLNTKLDMEQVIRRAYDEPQNRLRVDAQVSATIGTVNVIIDAASGDNIAITSQTTGFSLEPNSDGSINVVFNGVTTSAGDYSKVGLDVNNLNKVFSKPFDEIEVTAKNSDGDPTIITSKLNTTLVQTVTITYDVDGDFQKLVVV
jgi:hypothetical protein